MMDRKPCPTCRAPGEQPGRCVACRGTGRTVCVCFECDHEHERDCEECEGSGDCPRCAGQGEVGVTERDLEARGQLRLVP